MPFSFSLKSSLLLFFFVHGLVFTFLLVEKGISHQNKSSVWLGAFSLICALYIAPFMFGYAGWYGLDGFREFLFYMPFQQLFLIGLVIYYYTKSLLNKSFRFQARNWLHFLPALAYLLYSAVVFVADNFALEEIYFYADGRDKDFDPWYQIAGLVSLLIYVIMSLSYYGKYKKLTYQVVSFADEIAFNWIQRYLAALLLIILLRVLFFVLNPEWGEFGSKFWYYSCFSVLFYYITLSGYTHSVRAGLSFYASGFDSNLDGYLPDSESITKSPPSPKENFSPEELDLWKKKIADLMKTDRLFEDPGLTLTDVADKIGIPSKQVSQVVNQGHGVNFNDFVNQYRTEAVILKFEKGAQRTKTLLGIALESGFNSKSTFNRAFKKSTSLSPKEYLERLDK